MPSLGMQGPYALTDNDVDQNVSRVSAGNYALGRKSEKGAFLVGFVGRSDCNVNADLKDWVDKSNRHFFKFSYAESVREAFEKECKNYHDFNPPDNDSHPQNPKDSNWKCPVCEDVCVDGVN